MPCAYLDVKTDAINLQLSHRHLAKVQKAVEAVRFCDLHLLGTERGQKRLWDGAAVHPRTSQEPVFSFSAEGRRLQGAYREPLRDVAAPTVTGRSYAVAGLCLELAEAGRRVCVVSKTHAQCANFIAHLGPASTLRAITADHWANAYVRRGRCPFDTVVVEEASMIDTRLWNAAAKASLVVPQWILVADWNQFQAVADTWCGTPVEREVKSSDLI